MRDFCVVIPAVKKDVAFNDDLVKKLGGVSLIQRAIDKACALAPAGQVHVITDSEEIRLVCERSGVRSYVDAKLRLSNGAFDRRLRAYLESAAAGCRGVMVVHPYAPMVGPEKLRDAWRRFRGERCDALISVKKERHRLFLPKGAGLRGLVHDDRLQDVFTEVRAFQILAPAMLGAAPRRPRLSAYFLDDDEIEIESYRDWWICEKLLQRRRIVFRVVGDAHVGMGHIYRALTLAHEITDHEIIFVCDQDSSVAATKLAAYDYRLEVFPADRLAAGILGLKPDLVVNDMLDTERGYVKSLQAAGARVVNFEDFGSGAAQADLTINELFDRPVVAGARIRWGHRYYFVRDEFDDAEAHRFKRKVRGLLITFGGVDSSDFTRKTLAAVAPYCRERGVRIHVVTGEGYAHRGTLVAQLRKPEFDHVEYTYATGVMSSIMERAEIAICSNGRTVYELAHMNVPAIVIAHHPRENTHRFACAANGFHNLGLYRAGTTERRLLRSLKRMVEDARHRRALFHRIRRFEFRGNKRRVVELILGLLK
jgi:spore coat polysaccharide biosynthesis predicted glycosyltransferase SpsG/CMP-N-acetylneuraminic acid synthetase